MNNTYNRLLDLVVNETESLSPLKPGQTETGRNSQWRDEADRKKDLDAKNPKQPLARKTRIPKDKFLNHKNTDLRKDEGKIGDLVQKVKDRVTRERARWNKAQGKAQDNVTGRDILSTGNKEMETAKAPFGRNNKGEPRKGPDNGRQRQHN
jgi:hypothetical protein